MVMATHIILALLGFGVYFVCVIRATGYLTPAALFSYVQLVMAVGTFRLIIPDNDIERFYGDLTLGALLVYLAVSFLVMLHNPPLIKRNRVWSPSLPVVVPYRPRTLMWVLLGVSGLITIGYYQAVGHSALIEGLRQTVLGGDEDLAGMRLSAYSGENYFFPGYVNQFKNVLGPSIIVLIITYWSTVGKRRIFVSSALVIAATFALLGTGQRGAFVQFSVVVIVYIFILAGRRLPRGAYVGVSLMLLVIAVATVALGRSEPNSQDSEGWAGRIADGLGGFGGRVFEEQQSAGLAGFHYIATQPIQWGSEWASSFRGVLPGSSGSTLATDIFETIYGSRRGTASPTLWGSIYHNFGAVGVVVGAVGMGVIVSLVSRKINSYRKLNSLQALGMSGVATVIGFWAAGSPIFLLNNGIVVYLGLWTLGTLQARKLGQEEDFRVGATRTATNRIQ